MNVVHPGMTNTSRVRTINQARTDSEGKDVEALLKELASKLPAGRIAEPEEVALTVAFFSSEACSYVFGSSIYMDVGHCRATP